MACGTAAGRTPLSCGRSTRWVRLLWEGFLTSANSCIFGRWQLDVCQIQATPKTEYFRLRGRDWDLLLLRNHHNVAFGIHGWRGATVRMVLSHR